MRVQQAAVYGVWTVEGCRMCPVDSLLDNRVFRKLKDAQASVPGAVWTHLAGRTKGAIFRRSGHPGLESLDVWITREDPKDLRRGDVYIQEVALT